MRKRGFTVVELLVVVAIIGALMMILLPNLAAALERARQAQCAANLRSIGQSIKVYSSGNRGKWPSVFKSGDTTWSDDFNEEDLEIADYHDNEGNDPDDMVGYTYTNNLSCLYLLIRKGMSTPAVFQCPSCDYREDMEITDYESAWSFPLITNVSFSYQNQTGKGTTDSADSAMIVAADANPLRGDFENVDSTRSEDKSIMEAGDRWRLNSPNHDFEGQNCLYADGHVEWQTKPNVGVGDNNIWIANEYDGTNTTDPWGIESEDDSSYDQESPAGAKKDSFLVP